MKIIKNKKNLNYYLLPICLILVLSFSRIIPHPWNFTPIIATGIFSGFYFKQFFLSFFIVIFSMFIGDLYLGFHNTMLFTYISLAAVVLLGIYIKKLNYKKVFFSGFLGSMFFYLITNFGAWMTLPMYEKNFSGLMESYILAIPFFHNTLISTLFYLILLKLTLSFISKKNLIKISI
tara:strand:+ start:211 stop:741 length:531 start_codon:yes stop_codon:yes gene_type:complete